MGFVACVCVFMILGKVLNTATVKLQRHRALTQTDTHTETSTLVHTESVVGLNLLTNLVITLMWDPSGIFSTERHG